MIQSTAGLILQQTENTDIAAPATDIEKRLLPIWQRLFKKTNISVTDNFFDLGGDSLLAMTLLFLIEREFSRRLPLIIISKASTIKQQAEILQKGDELEETPVLIPIQTTGDKKPLYCIGGKGGNPVRFQNLLSYLAEDQPVYFLRARGLEASERIQATIEAMASDYLLEIKRVQPTGPYCFLGESSGGLVAYEMAQQLQARGEAAVFVGMLDTYLAELKGEQISSLANLLMLSKKHFQILTGGGIKGVRTYIRYYAGLWRYKASEFSNERKKKKILSRQGDASVLIEQVEKANISASRAYKPKGYTGQVVMFSAVRLLSLEEGNDADHGWGRVGIGNLVVHSLDCYHGNILFEPFVGQVAEILNKHLKD